MKCELLWCDANIKYVRLTFHLTICSVTSKTPGTFSIWSPWLEASWTLWWLSLLWVQFHAPHGILNLRFRPNFLFPHIFCRKTLSTSVFSASLGQPVSLSYCAKVTPFEYFYGLLFSLSRWKLLYSDPNLNFLFEEDCLDLGKACMQYSDTFSK